MNITYLFCFVCESLFFFTSSHLIVLHVIPFVQVRIGFLGVDVRHSVTQSSVRVS